MVWKIKVSSNNYPALWKSCLNLIVQIYFTFGGLIWISSIFFFGYYQSHRRKAARLRLPQVFFDAIHMPSTKKLSQPQPSLLHTYTAPTTRREPIDHHGDHSPRTNIQIPRSYRRQRRSWLRAEIRRIPRRRRAHTLRSSTSHQCRRLEAQDRWTKSKWNRVRIFWARHELRFFGIWDFEYQDRG